MCGIAGIIDRFASEETHRNKVLQMIATIGHRGPDGHGVATLKNGVAFGHTRLAILDLNAVANQPMESVSGCSTIIFNGEIYNHEEIRQDLIREGFTFRTRSDTEVLLNAYEYWGDDFVHKLNGMFAFALYDNRDHSVLLGRDRLGIKPLYYFSNNQQIIFASEIKAVRSVMEVQTGLDVEALAEYLAFQNNYTERTLVAGVKLFPPGSIAKISADQTLVKPKRYWEATIAVDKLTSQERAENLAALLDQSVNEQLAADVPVNAFISGGLDSCAIAAAATRKVGRIKTFTCGFDMSEVTESERLFDERQRAELMSAALGSEHYEVVLKEDDFLSRMANWAWHAEEPRVGSTFPNFCAADLASRFTKVCLSGTGADELFGGYPWRYQAALTAQTDAEFIDNYANFWNRMLAPQAYKELMAPIANQISFAPHEAFSNKITAALARTQESDYRRADAALLFEMETFLHGLLVAEDKSSMAHGLEIRVPLIDNRLIDTALSLPFNEKVGSVDAIDTNSIYGKGSAKMPAFTNGKMILRKVLNPYVPAEISGGRKQGFSPPVETWFRRKMQPWITEEVFGNATPMADFLDMRCARKLWSEHVNGQANHRLFIWGMVALYLFTTEFLRK